MFPVTRLYCTFGLIPQLSGDPLDVISTPMYPTPEAFTLAFNVNVPSTKSAIIPPSPVTILNGCACNSEITLTSPA